MGNFVDLTGKQIGMWKVLYRVPPQTSSHSTSWMCECVCGERRVRLRTNLLNGKNTGCGCAHWAQKQPYEALFNELKRNAAKDERVVELTYEDFVEFTKQARCSYCGGLVTWVRKHLFRNGNAYNLDRKDNSLGYTKDNCVVCCARCNRAKSNHFTYDEWKQLGDVIRTWD